MRRLRPTMFGESKRNGFNMVPGLTLSRTRYFLIDTIESIGHSMLILFTSIKRRYVCLNIYKQNGALQCASITCPSRHTGLVRNIFRCKLLNLFPSPLTNSWSFSLRCIAYGLCWKSSSGGVPAWYQPGTRLSSHIQRPGPIAIRIQKRLNWKII